MKLLGWMHRKGRQNSGKLFKDLAIGCSCTCLSGQPSDDNREGQPKLSFSSRPLRQPQRNNYHLMTAFAGLEAAAVEEDNREDQSANEITEPFHGFLTIGTLGSYSVVTEPATPTFSLSVENVTEKETEVTDNELKLINDELEKVLGAEAKEDGCHDSSGRNSQVSTITLGGNQMGRGEVNENGAMTACPLQGYLFGSSIELPETPSVEKKEHRISLGELFQRSKIAEEASRDEKRKEKEADKSAVQFMKKMLKRPMLHTSRSSSPAADASHSATDSASMETKLHKILHMFHRKIHPESPTARTKFNKSKKCEIKKPYNGVYNSGDQRNSDEDTMMFSQSAISKETTCHIKSRSCQPQFAVSKSGSIGNREYWIKTDAEYLVLEL